ncbi:MAG: 4Fe-4S binding protein [Dehalococcoidia bacterium]|nr:4Fe-4S binding protein [Dehalococcoidia bacterium]
MAKKLTWRDLEVGNIVTEPGNSAERSTGDWRTERPVFDKSICIKCGLCWLHCPDSAIKILDDGYYDVDLFYCKGCGICESVCPKKGAIVMVEEEEK